MKKIMFLAMLIICSVSFIGCTNSKDSISSCVIETSADEIAQKIIDKENIYLKWQNKQGLEWSFAVEKLTINEKVYLITNPNNEYIFHINGDNALQYNRETSQNWEKITVSLQQVENIIILLLLDGILNEQNMGALCEEDYFMLHSQKVKICKVLCYQLDLQLNDNVRFYVSEDLICYKWENISHENVGGQITSISFDVNIPIPVI